MADRKPVGEWRGTCPFCRAEVFVDEVHDTFDHDYYRILCGPESDDEKACGAVMFSLRSSKYGDATEADYSHLTARWDRHHG